MISTLPNVELELNDVNSTSIRTTLFELVAAVSDEVEPEEEHLIPLIVSHILHDMQNWEIKENVNDQLYWSPFVDADDVTVKVDNGVVTLSGTVETWSELLDAEKNAYEGGAKDVVNNLVVSHTVYGPYYPFEAYAPHPYVP